MMGDKKATYLIFADGSEEFQRSVRYTALAAKQAAANILIVHVLSQQDFQPWGGVEARMKAEQRQDAEKLLEEVSREIKAISGVNSVVAVVEGKKSEVVLEQLEKDRSITKLILSSNVSGYGQGPLLEYFTGKGAHELNVPLTVVPGHLPLDDIDKLI